MTNCPRNLLHAHFPHFWILAGGGEGKHCQLAIMSPQGSLEPAMDNHGFAFLVIYVMKTNWNLSRIALRYLLYFLLTTF